jgi:hypothetical protein
MVLLGFKLTYKGASSLVISQINEL